MQRDVIIVVLSAIAPCVACSGASQGSDSNSESALTDGPVDKGEIAYGGTGTGVYLDKEPPRWRFRGRQGDIVRVSLQAGPVGDHDLGNTWYAMELAVQDMGSNPLWSEVLGISQDPGSLSYLVRLPYNGNYFLLAQNTRVGRASVTVHLDSLARAGSPFKLSGTAKQRNTALTRAPDCSALGAGDSTDVPIGDDTTSLGIDMGGAILEQSPVVGRCSPQTIPALAQPVTDDLVVSVDDPSPPWQVSCTGPKKLTYHAHITPHHGPQWDPKERVTVQASCEDLAGRTEYTFDGVLPYGTL